MTNDSNQIVQEEVLPLKRDLSWLSFNHRVLQESTDKTVPLYDRIRYLGIYSSNLDEFYQVRISSLLKRDLQDHKVEQELRFIQTKVNQLQKLFDKTYQQLRQELHLNNINIRTETDVLEQDTNFVWNYFEEHVEPHLSIQMLNQRRSIEKYLLDNVIYLAVEIVLKNSDKIVYAVINIPPFLDRFVRLPTHGKVNQIMLLDDVIRFSMSRIFSMYDVETTAAYNVKITRDAEIANMELLGHDYVNKLQAALKKRKTGRIVRTIIDKDMPSSMRSFLFSRKAESEAIEGQRYHNFKDYREFPMIGALQDKCYKPLLQKEHSLSKSGTSIFEAIREKDHLITTPYESFRPVIDFLIEAALSQEIDTIYITFYRLAKNSQIVNALLNALRNGKKVYIYAELTARFDEAANLEYAQMLEEEGATLIPLLQGYKVHAKFCVVSGRYRSKRKRYAFFSTGNLNEETANVYSDFILFTSKPEICDELYGTHRLLMDPLVKFVPKKLSISPVNTYQNLLELIETETKNANQGKPAWIKIKANNLTHGGLIAALEKASNAGVKIDLIVRSTMLIQPNKRHLKGNINAISIVGRFLEHSRCFIFANANEPKYFIASADLMPRNMYERVEVLMPIVQNDIKQYLSLFFKTQLSDAVKGRILDRAQSNKSRINPDSTNKVNSQSTLLKYFGERY